MAVVPHASIHQARDPCQHGPFCARCGSRKEEQTLPLCECRALVCGWSPHLPPPERPAQSEADPAVLLRRARAAVDVMVAAGGADPEPAKDGGATRPPPSEATAPSFSPREQFRVPAQPATQAGLQPRRPERREAGSATLAQSLQLRGGLHRGSRPLAAQAPSSGSLMSYFSDALKQLHEAYESFESSLGCVNPTFADDQEIRHVRHRRGGG